jgi:hypothetical protein
MFWKRTVLSSSSEYGINEKVGLNSFKSEQIRIVAYQNQTLRTLEVTTFHQRVVTCEASTGNIHEIQRSHEKKNVKFNKLQQQ